MAEQFTPFSPAVPLGTTWQELLLIEDIDGNPVDLTGLHVRAQLHEEVPVRDADTGLPVVAPVIEFTTPGFYTVMPSWPVAEIFDVPNPVDGAIYQTVPVADLWTASPTNEGRKLVWDVRIVNKTTGVVRPAFTGSPTFLPARTL